MGRSGPIPPSDKNKGIVNIDPLIIDTTEDQEDDSFIESAVVGYFTDSAVIGAMVGGNLLGGMIGESMND